ncbi:MAG: YfiR family protein [Acidobacteriota bacterium]
MIRRGITVKIAATGALLRLLRITGWMVVIGIVGLPATGMTREARDDSCAYGVKSGFLLNFARLVRWPADLAARDNEPLVIGLAGGDASVALLQGHLDRRTVRGHPVQTRRLTAGDDPSGYAIVFVARDSPGALADALSALPGRGLLLVGETPGFAGRGGVINFYADAGRVRFEINRGEATRRALVISSRLLDLARLVSDAPPAASDR